MKTTNDSYTLARLLRCIFLSGFALHLDSHIHNRKDRFVVFDIDEQICNELNNISYQIYQ